MQDLNRALADITAIKAQIARDTQFRGFGPATAAVTGLLALMAAAVQGSVLPDAAARPGAYVALWIATAALAAALVAAEVVTRSRRLHSGLAESMIFGTLEQFLPAAVAGALLTAVLFRFSPESVPLLPGLWQILFALGVFASGRMLPRSLFAAGVWYLLTGLASLAVAGGPAALSPWTMGLPFGLGQLLVAVLLHRSAGGLDDA